LPEREYTARSRTRDSRYDRAMPFEPLIGDGLLSDGPSDPGRRPRRGA
jgi:hypothetical protein